MRMITSLFSRFKLDFLIIALLGATLPLFFYKLGQSSLANWDEAWYAEIARNILKSGDFINLVWNGSRYYDHPPVGFWLIAISFKIFGISDFWTRFPSAVLGFLSLPVLYLLGKELFNRTVGFASALALASSFWFVYRARSGNLDVFLTFFFILTFLLALKSVKNKKYLLPFSLSLGLLFLTKSLVPLTILPALLIIFWGTKFKWKELVLPLAALVVLLGSWFLTQFLSFGNNFLNRYLMIGFPQGGLRTDYLENLKLTKGYLHSGVGKWFWPGALSVLSGVFLLQKRFLLLLVFSAVFILPFMFSHKGQIWHLIPLYPFMALTFFGLFYVLLTKILRKAILVSIFLLAVCFYFSYIQTKQMWYQFIDIPAYISDEAILSKEAGKYEGKLYIDGGNFQPAAVFYSGKNASQVWERGLPELFARENKIVLITHQWRLDQAEISKDRYRIIKSDRDKILVLSN